MATEQEQEYEGASQSERVMEACRGNNTDLLQEIIAECKEQGKDEKEIATLINSAKNAIGNYGYHEAALRGNYEIIDMLLDQEGFECDPINRMEGDTPLHSAVRWANGLREEQWEEATELIKMMIEAGSDPKVRNKGYLKAAELVDPANKELRKAINDAENEAAFMQLNRGDFINEDDDEGPTGSNSDSE